MWDRQAGFIFQHHPAQVLRLEARCLNSLSLYSPFFKTVMVISLLEGHEFIHAYMLLTFQTVS